jgi:hypothetical protein
MLGNPEEDPRNDHRHCFGGRGTASTAPAALSALLDSIVPSQKRLSLTAWHRLLGKLRSMSIALPGARGLFSAMQAVIPTNASGCLRLDKGFHDAIADLWWCSDSMRDRPTRLQELVAMQPALLGAHDASGRGAGGVWFPSPEAVSRDVQIHTLRQGALVQHSIDPRAPLLWRVPFDSTIHDRLVSFANPTGTVTIFASAPSNPAPIILSASIGIANALSQLQAQRLTSSVPKLSTSAIIPTSPSRIISKALAMAWQTMLLDYWICPLTNFSLTLTPVTHSPDHDFSRYFPGAQEEIQAGVGSSRADAASAHWAIWEQFCRRFSLDPTLQGIKDPVPILQARQSKSPTGPGSHRGRCSTFHWPNICRSGVPGPTPNPCRQARLLPAPPVQCVCQSRSAT